VSEVAVALANFGGVCGGLGSAGGSDAVLSLVALGSGPGTYTIEQGAADVSYMAQFDSACHTHTWTTTNGGGTATDHAAVFHEGASGTITLTTVSATKAEGTFDVTFDTGDHVTGTFSAGNCTPSGGGSSC
jgi:hypothetical protein